MCTKCDIVVKLDRFLRDSNSRSSVYETDALPLGQRTELRWPKSKNYWVLNQSHRNPLIQPYSGRDWSSNMPISTRSRSKSPARGRQTKVVAASPARKSPARAAEKGGSKATPKTADEPKSAVRFFNIFYFCAVTIFLCSSRCGRVERAQVSPGHVRAWPQPMYHARTHTHTHIYIDERDIFKTSK